MEPNNNHVLLVFFFFLFFFNPAEAICVPRNPSHHNPSPPSSSPPNLKPAASPHSQSVPSSPQTSAPPPVGGSNPPLNLKPTSSPQSQSVPSSPQNSAPPPNDVSARLNLPPAASSQKSQSVPSSPSQNPTPSPDVAVPSPHISVPPSDPLQSLSQKLNENHDTTNLFSKNIFPLPDLSLNAIPPPVKKICEATDNPALCLSSIAPFMNGKTDIHSVLEISIKACSQYAKVALSAATNLASGPHMPAAIAAAINDCKEIYSDAMDNLQSAVDAIMSRDVGTINSMLSAAVTDFVTCEDGFAGENSPVTFFNEKLRKMASNGLAIASLMK